MIRTGDRVDDASWTAREKVEDIARMCKEAKTARRRAEVARPRAEPRPTG